MAEPNYDEIRRRITKRYDNRTEFFSHLIAFLAFNGLGWMLWLGTPYEARSGVLGVLLLITSVGWLVGLLIHMVMFLMNEARERAIEQAIEREREWVSMGEKPKRDRLTRLSEDGELMDVMDEEVETPKKRRPR